MSEKMAQETFVKTAIVKLRKPPYKGIHTVFSGFNAAFREYYPETDPVKAINSMTDSGVIQSHFAKGGAMIYLPGESSKAGVKTAKDTLAKIFG